MTRMALLAVVAPLALLTTGCGSSDGADTTKDPNYSAPISKKTTPGSAPAKGKMLGTGD